jgi:hypothetical protein
MPQPALHLLLARQTLARWDRERIAPFDTADERARNAFLHGSLAPDMGNFPGGRSDFAHTVHTVRTGRMQRALMDSAVTMEERAFAWGWLTHVIADVLVHPLVNEDAARRNGGAASLVEHVRVEVGIDAWFCWQHASLAGLRLRPAFVGTGYGFLSRAIRNVLDMNVSAHQLVQMERGLMIFSHAALRFATSLARHLCWGEPAAGPTPLSSAAVWHTASRLSPRNTVVHAYLNPHRPERPMLGRVDAALETYHTMLDALVVGGLRDLPDYNLEDGTIADAEPRQRVA